MRWRGHFYVDLSLPFSLRSVPFIFNSTADMAEWILLHKHRLSDLSMKVYLSAVRSLHIEQGFPDPLLNCLRLQQVLRVFTRSLGSPAARHLPITDSLLLVIHRMLDLNIFYHCAFWAACMLGSFGFLRAAELRSPI